MASILLLNTSFRNKGDALMTRAVQQELGASHHYSISSSLAFESREEARGFDVCLVSDLPHLSWKRRTFNVGARIASLTLGLVPKAAREKLGVALARDIDVAIDVSGYCFGDPWGETRVRHFTGVYRQLRTAGAKVILLPKTWGPFKTIRQEAVQSLIEEVDLAFARDQRSFAAIRGQLDDESQAKIQFAPDYTHAVSPSASNASGQDPEPYACIIPNMRVIDYQMTFEDYFSLLSLAAESFRRKGLRPKLLLHEVLNDLRFLDGAPSLGFGPCDVLLARDELDAKATIAGASAVVTSRLHGLYNSLNSLVPVAVIGWNFKYEEALKQYGCSDHLIDRTNARESLRAVLEKITDPGRRAELKERMARGKQISAQQTEAMWERVFEVAGLTKRN